VTPSNLITDFGIKALFHFTDTRNIDSIREHGLLSYAELQRRSVDCFAPGGNEWSHDADERLGLDEYVHLCMLEEHPMEFRARQEGRIVESTFVRVLPSVLTIPGVLFTADVANKAGVATMSLTEARANLDLDVIYRRTNWKDPAVQQRRQAAKKYEVLVPTEIRPEFLFGL
jgi:hypothetical protein